MRAMFLECSAPFWEVVADDLARDPGLEPVYWTGLPHYASALRARFPSLMYHDCTDAKYGRGGVEAYYAPRGLDVPASEVWREDAQTLLDMLSRFDLSRDFGFVDRRRHLRRLFTYWLNALDEIRPDVAVFPNPPHVVYDYIVYRLCLKRGIRTVMWCDTAVTEDHIRLSLSLTTFEEGSRLLRETYARLLAERPLRQPRLSDGVAASLAAQRAPYEVARPEPERRAREAAEDREREEFRARDREYLRNVAARDVGVASGFAPPSRDWLTSCWKELGVPLDASFEGPFAWSKFELTARWWWKSTSERRAFYDELVRPVDVSSPWVYLPLAGQPERTSNPQGGIFTDQTLMIEMLVDALPAGWQLLVREHGRHFDAVFHGHTCRTPEFYTDVAAMPRVSWVGLDVDPFTLIDGARAVATIAGTSGWEALVRGVPALVFGATWYAECDGAHQVRTRDECRDALARIAAGSRPDRRKVDLFAEAIDTVGIRGMADPLPPSWGLSDEDNGRRLAESARQMLAAWG